MEVATGRARLVEFADDGASGALATLPRSEIEDALRAEDGPPELVLDVTRSAEDGQEETGSVYVLWGREELEEVLRRAEGDSVTLAFDPDELLQAFEADVEGHGLREAAAILGVAVAVGIGAGAATAQPAEGTGAGGSTAIEQVRSDATAPVSAAIEAVRSAEGAQTLAASGGQPVAAGIEAVRAAEGAQTLAASGGQPVAADIEAVRSDEAASLAAARAPFDIEGVRLAQGSELLASASAPAGADIEAVRSAANVSGLTAAESVEAARSTEIAATAASAQSASEIEAVRSAAAEATRAAADTGGGISISMPSPAATGAITGAIALLITGAAFAARRRQPPVQPA
jgi:hypothetical protein